MKNQTTLNAEDLIKDLYGRTCEISSCCNILYNAICCEAEEIDMEDIKNYVYLLTEHLQKLKEETSNYIDYCEETDIFKSSDSVKSKA